MTPAELTELTADLFTVRVERSTYNAAEKAAREELALFFGSDEGYEIVHVGGTWPSSRNNWNVYFEAVRK